MRRKTFLIINGLVILLNLGLLVLNLSLGLSPLLPVLSFLAGSFGFSYWLFHDQ